MGKDFLECAIVLYAVFYLIFMVVVTVHTISMYGTEKRVRMMVRSCR